MLIRIFGTRQQAERFAFPFLKRDRTIGIRKLNSGRWEARIGAKRN